MSRFLSDLLDAEEPLFSEALRQLEATSGHTGADVKLIGDITGTAHASIRKLGLVSEASTGEEVFYALLAQFGKDNSLLAQRIGADLDRYDDVRHVAPLLLQAVEKVKFSRKVFVLKRDVAQKLLRKHPPTQLIQKLGYDTIEALFEHEDFDELYAALRFSEGPEWLNEYNKLFQQVKASDFEERDLRLIRLDQDKYADLAAQYVQTKEHTVTHAKEMGVVALVPIRARKSPGYALRTAPLVLHYANEVKTYANFFKLRSKQPKFGQVIVDTLSGEPDVASQFNGRRIHWRVIQRHLGEHQEQPFQKAFFEPHIQPEDLNWRRVADLMLQIESGLSFWNGLEYIGLNYDGFPVSFNIFDVGLAYSKKQQYAQRPVHHFRESLWNEIFIRYMGFNTLARRVLQRMNEDSIAPEQLPEVKVKQKVSKVRQDKTDRNLLIRRRLIDAAEGRLTTVVDEFEHVFEMLSKYEKTVTIFGSARKPQNDEVTTGAYELAARLAREDFAVITGGGHGVMEAANRGAYEAGGESIGLNIMLPFEQTLNAYTTDNFEFAHFFGRKVAMTLDSSAFIYFPGGFGTFDELFEILALVQTRKIDKTPVILVGSEFWRPFDAAIREVMLDRFHTISYEDTELYRIYDNYDDIVRYIKDSYRKEK